MAEQYYITVDNVRYEGIRVLKISRSFSVTDGENAGRLALTGKMVRDIIGTFYNYQFTIKPDKTTPAVYDAFYEVISAPVDSHEIIVPYAQGTMTFQAYVTNGNDNLNLIERDGTRKWDELSFSVIAMEPQRKPQ